jgi:flagellar biosynthetic protein FliQ
MDQNAALELGRHALQVALMVAFPLLAVSLFTGLAVSVFQAITSVQEMTLTFVPKLIGIGLVMLLVGSWMLTTVVTFTSSCLEQMARVGR